MTKGCNAAWTDLPGPDGVSVSHPCSDPWPTLVLSPAENRVTACCEFTAAGAVLVNPTGQPAPIGELSGHWL
ncbi:MAG: hypothetical protein EPN20_08630 [Magnetospirillum sp.]|nr:MAG: hypothetical protein EPN20_08630 [Magnetospirillum sp.]